MAASPLREQDSTVGRFSALSPPLMNGEGAAEERGVSPPPMPTRESIGPLRIRSGPIKPVSRQATPIKPVSSAWAHTTQRPLTPERTNGRAVSTSAAAPTDVYVMDDEIDSRAPPPPLTSSATALNVGPINKIERPRTPPMQPDPNMPVVESSPAPHLENVPAPQPQPVSEPQPQSGREPNSGALDRFKSAATTVQRGTVQRETIALLSNNGVPRSDAQLAARKKNNTISHLERERREAVTWQQYKRAGSINQELQRWHAYDLADPSSVKILADKYRQDKIEAAQAHDDAEQRRSKRREREERRAKKRKDNDIEIERLEEELQAALDRHEYKDAARLGKRLQNMNDSTEKTSICCNLCGEKGEEDILIVSEEDEDDDDDDEDDDEDDDVEEEADDDQNDTKIENDDSNVLNQKIEDDPEVAELFDPLELKVYRECFDFVDTYKFGKIREVRL
eukprot:SAG31_NODE_774_length_12192_cov_26.736128_10_plen_452_part_00